MFGMLGCAILFYTPKTVITAYYKEKAMFVLSLSCIFLVLYLPFSNNTAYAWNRIEIKAPLVGLAIAFAVMGKIAQNRYHFLLALYVLLCLITATYTLGNYLIHYESVTESYLRAKVMPSFVNHVRYSIMLAMGSYTAWYLYQQDYVLGRLSKKVFLIIAVLLFVFLHIYSVRSGLVAMYGILFVEMLLFVKRTRNYKVFAGICFGMVLSIILAVSFIPTLQNKWVNTVSDVKVYVDKGYPNYNSLTTRFISYEGAIFILKKEPFGGCGLGDIKDEMDSFFKVHFPLVETPILPHNQFLFYLAATGIFGFVVFCITFYFPLFYNRNWKNKMLLMQYVVLTLSFMTEPMLETQLGMAFSVLFILLPLSQQANEQEQIEAA